jgi:hypothetical protein
LLIERRQSTGITVRARKFLKSDPVRTLPEFQDAGDDELTWFVIVGMPQAGAAVLLVGCHAAN